MNYALLAVKFQR